MEATSVCSFQYCTTVVRVVQLHEVGVAGGGVKGHGTSLYISVYFPMNP